MIRRVLSLKNCEICHGAYAPYKTGKDEDIGAYHRLLPADVETKGVCQFHNPMSKLYVNTTVVVARSGKRSILRAMKKVIDFVATYFIVLPIALVASLLLAIVFIPLHLLKIVNLVDIEPLI